MLSQYDNILQLTSEHLPDADRSRRLSVFAQELGWRPSDRLDEPLVQDFATAHLLVEHGLENTAVLSFLRRSADFREIGTDQTQRLLSLSYNNLVDWHVVIEADAVNYVYVRTRVPTIVERSQISRDRLERVRSEIFEEIIERRPNPNVPALDDSLIRTISFWKRNLAAQLDYKTTNEQLSALFNSIMFVRAVEDYNARVEPRQSALLLDALQQPNGTLTTALSRSYETLVRAQAPSDLFNIDKLKIFERLPPVVVQSLVNDFYHNKYAPYRYDFCVMSKHALSRIYEHYVSILKVEETAQLSLLPSLPVEHTSKTTGAIYTPHFIARFFARFLREELSPVAFRNLRSADPACGSGMFLRTLIELQAETLHANLDPNVSRLFEQVTGLDIDENAVEATRLSLALLHLALTGNAPSTLNIIHADALTLLHKKKSYAQKFDALLANPPFVSTDTQSAETRQLLSDFLGPSARGRVDLYLAFIKLSLDLLRPGGFGLFVLPHSFLIAKSARAVRELLFQSAWIRAVVDLSTIPVFGETGVYVVLLVFQKKAQDAHEPTAMIVRATDKPGRALQARPRRPTTRRSELLSIRRAAV